MPVTLKRCTLFVVFFFVFNGLFAQYTVNGFAAQLSCNEYRLTQAANGQNGSVWNNNKINLTQSFDFKFDVFLGDNDSPGADGIAFVLQPISTSVGSVGGGLGYQGIAPAVGVTLDTYPNAGDNDPAFDHIAVQLNGNLVHNTANNIAGPVQIKTGVNNVEDRQWHALRVVWDAPAQRLTVYFDGELRLTTIKDFVTDVFAGNPLVFWGFTGSTGGENNYQGFKTALNPAFVFTPGQKRCVNEPITFKDSTISFTNIVKFYWDFGDGSPIDSVNLNPVHTYTIGGDYIVKQRVIGADGCEATNTQTVRIGTIPFVTILPNNTYLCADFVPFRTTTWVDVGTIDSLGWNWDFDNGLTSNISNPSTYYTLAGVKNIKCTAKTLEGCVSPVADITLQIKSKAFADFTFDDTVCVGEQVQFFSQATSIGGDTVRYLRWYFTGTLDTLFNNIRNPFYTYTAPGVYNVGLLAVTNNSEPLFCPGIKFKTIIVKDKPNALIGITSFPLCASGIIQFTDSSTGGDTTVKAWSWRYNNTEWATTKNTSNTFLAGNQTVQLIATSAAGCKSDTGFKTFYVNPIPSVSISFKDACKFTPVNFTATDNSGTVTQWKWEFGDGATATTQNAQHTYNANGVYKVKLFASAANGCFAGTQEKDITIYGTNAFAGNDTIAAAGQPVQLHATGGLSYTWSPANLLNDATSASPLATLQSTQTFTLKAFTPEGCESYDDVTVKIYKGPDIYLPNAFTPNGDGLNDIFRGIPVGLQQLDYIKVFNRWGQLIFNTADYRKGWDGNWLGQKQPGGVYVVIAAGTDYTGKTITKKATVMLIR